MKLMTSIFACFFMLVMVGNASAAKPAKVSQTEDYIKKMLVMNLGAGIKIDSVIKTPYSGLYEVRMGSEIVYTDAKAEYIFLGEIIDSKGTINYSKQRKEDINRINFSDLPLDLAVKYVKGDGKRVMAIFEDPNCGYCKKFRKNLQVLDNITIYTFMYNILAEDSALKSRDIWCSPNRSKAWDDWMINDKPAAPAPANCQSPNDKVLALGRQMHLSSTPNIFFTDGTRMTGMVEIKTLEDKFLNIKAPAIAAK